MTPNYISVPTDYVVPHGAQGVWLVSEQRPMVQADELPEPVRLRNGQLLRPAYIAPQADLDRIVRACGEW